MKPKSSIRKIAVAMQREASSKIQMRQVSRRKLIADTIVACFSFLMFVLNLIEVSPQYLVIVIRPLNFRKLPNIKGRVSPRP
jgi:hypothetical protein